MRGSAPPVSEVLAVVAEVLGAFGMDARAAVAPHGSGHIHATFRVDVAPPAHGRWILQRINRRVFADPERVVTNAAKVGRYVAAGAPGFVPVPLAAADGRPWVRDAEGEYWRLLPWIAHARTYDVTPTPVVARGAGTAFGRFHALTDGMVVDFPPAIDDFLSLPVRLAELEAAARSAPAVRHDRCRDLLAEVERRQADIVSAVAPGSALVHADCKVNNVLFGDGDAPLAVVDLDTVMAGNRALDFGDLVRSACATAAEDEPDTARVGISIGAFVALSEGYLGAAGQVLEPAEHDALVDGAVYMSFMLGVRFLADYLRGDTYFTPRRAGQNLDRAHVQLRLAELLGVHAQRLRAIIARSQEGGGRNHG